MAAPLWWVFSIRCWWPSLGCILATVLGIFAGVLRLSNNWLVARLMTVYVEGFRNVPLLLWIIVIFAIMTEAMPQPREFREGGTASMLLNDSFAITGRGIYAPLPIWGEGSAILVAVFVASLIGIWAFRRYARKRQEATGDILPVFWVSAALFFIPSILFFFILGRPVSLEYPELQASISRAASASARQLADRAVASRCRSIPAPSSPRSCAPASSRSARARPRRRLCAGPAAEPDDEPGDPAAGAAGDHPAADLAISEPDQEQLARHRRGLHGRAPARWAASR
jgi:His/Glu/Gln/Arg/opine family amino acid ABC transporter permease subunit